MRLCSCHIFPWLDSCVTLRWSCGHGMWNKSPGYSHQLLLWISAIYWVIYKYLLCCFYSVCSLKQSVPALGEACHSTQVPTFIVQFSCSVVSDSLWPHEPQHTRPPCPSPTPGVYPNSCPLGWWCHPTISSSVFPFSSCLQSFPASGSFQMSQLFTSGGQSIGVSASTSGLEYEATLSRLGLPLFQHYPQTWCQSSVIKWRENGWEETLQEGKERKRERERGRAWTSCTGGKICTNSTCLEIAVAL